MSITPNPDFLPSIAEMSEKYGVPTDEMKLLIRLGVIRGTVCGEGVTTRYRVDETDLVAFLSQAGK